MKPVILALSIILLISAISLIIYVAVKRQEGYSDKLDYKTDMTGGLYTVFENSYLPYPSGELIIDPAYTTKKFIDYDHPNIYTDVPPGLFEKGNFNAVYTPDLQWCKDGNCSNVKVFYLNAGELFSNTSGKMFVSQDPQRASQLELDTTAYMFMNPDGSVCVRPVKIKESGKRQVLPQQCLALTVGDNYSFNVNFIGLDKEGTFRFIGPNAIEYPLHISTVLNAKGKLIPVPKISSSNSRKPYAILLDDCSFAIYDGNGTFQYQASL